MDILNGALGSLERGVPQGSPVTSLAESPSSRQQSGTSAAAAAGLPASRDSMMAEQPGITSSVNLLQQAASQAAGAQATVSQADDSGLDQLSFPALPAMPAPQPAPPVPTDDH